MSDVSRSVYQKLAEENKRLKADIYVLVMLDLREKGNLERWNRIDSQWREKFKKDEALRQALHEYAVQYVKDNPDSVVAQLAREIQTPKK
jgi:hypothetical protein